MKKLIPKLCKLANKIQTLTIENYHLDTESLTELLSSQTAIQTIRINIDDLPSWVKNAYFQKIVEVIIKNQERMEVIEIKVATRDLELKMSRKSIRSIQSIIAAKGRLSFPCLKSLKLTDEAYRAFKELSNDFFESLTATSQLQELEFPDYVDILPYIENGNLELLKIFPALHFQDNTGELIKHCPNITHVHGATRRNLHEIISTYGPQLKSFGGSVNRGDAANAILRECKNLESLDLVFYPPDDNCLIEESLAIKRAIPLFGYLEKLTEMEICSKYFEIEAEVVCKLIKNCGMKVQSLTLTFRGFESHKILNEIGANCKNLKKLKLTIENIEDYGHYEMKEIPTNRKLPESVRAILVGCQKLRTLHVYVRIRSDGWSWSDTNCNCIIYDQIGNKQPYLEHLELAFLWQYPKANFVKLIEALPYCNIEEAPIMVEIDSYKW
eukprot:Seg5368.1 transcript_id=Seg5368.1/GoldUCD/mRNA.D3Y31 product="hypothetical protein" protein_id=Seg5368.1/GoldUCD/D3Y31